MRRIVPLSVSLSALLLVPCIGCGSSAGPAATILPVKGKVTYKGKALTGGTVTFEPDGGAGRDAHGEVRPDGTFELTTFKPGDGAMVGTHRVAITGSVGKGRSNAVPWKYRNPSSSKLEAEVSANKTEYTFDLD